MSAGDGQLLRERYTYPSWSTPIWPSVVAKKIDTDTAAEFHIEPLALMETAGRAVAKHVLAELASRPRPVLILAGHGNNGGDALVIARVLADHGASLQVVTVGAGEESSAYARQAATLERMQVAVTAYRPGLIAKSSSLIVVDGIFGLGFRGELPQAAKSALEEARAAAADLFVVAIDVPSGMAVDGFSEKAPLTANLTITFGGKKACHALSPARDACGLVVVEDVGFPRACQTSAIHNGGLQLCEIDTESIMAIDPWQGLSPSAHKFDRGHVLVVGGSAGKLGAPRLSGMAALRSGAGWATLALPEQPSSLEPDLTCEALWRSSSQIDAARLRAFCRERKVRVLVVGPGTVASPMDDELLQTLCELSKSLTIIIDGGALDGLSARLAAKNLRFQPEKTLLTPHPGEWQKLFAGKIPMPTNIAQLPSALASCQKLGAHVLLKTATPLLFGPASPALVCTSGSVALGKAGSGDVLAGVIAAHALPGKPLALAATRAYTLVAQRAKILECSLGQHGLTPSALIAAL